MQEGEAIFRNHDGWVVLQLIENRKLLAKRHLKRLDLVIHSGGTEARAS